VGPALGETHHVIAPDLKGHGDSDKPDSGCANTQIVAEVAGLCGALGVKRVALIGHSWGGAIGVLLATSTELVERLVLEDPVLLLPEDRRTEFSAQFALTVGLDPAEARARYNATTVAAGWTEVDIEGKVEAAVKGSPDAVRAVFRENAPWDLREQVTKIACPTLMLNAAREVGGLVHPEVEALARQNANVRIVTVPDADHNVHRTAFEAFMREVRGFVDE